MTGAIPPAAGPGPRPLHPQGDAGHFVVSFSHAGVMADV